METGKMASFILLLIGQWCTSEQISLTSPYHHLCQWNLLESPESGGRAYPADRSFQVNCSGLGLRSVPSSGEQSPIQIQIHQFKLDLSYNNITVIQRAHFNQPLCHYYTQLILSHNSIEKIDDGALSNLNQLLELNLSYNRLRVVTERMFQGLRKLGVLDLRHNQLQWIHKTAFADLTQLEVLWLQGNNLQVVPAAVNHLTELKTLSLGSNRLSQLHTGDLCCCPDLQTLHLERNHISALADDLFQNHGHLKTLDLSSNQLSGLDDITVRQLWERGVDLRFHGNPFRCDCGSEQRGKGPVWLTDAVVCQENRTRYYSMNEEETQHGKGGNLRVHTTVTLNGVLGKSLTIPCGDNYNGMLLYWKTPDKWLRSRLSCDGHSDLRCSCDGSVTILNFTCHNTGLYYCLLQENNHGRVIIPYRVSTSNCHSSLPSKPRLSREVRVESQEEDAVSEGHFAAAVASSVLLTFVGGLALGALSSPCLTSCLQRAKSRFRRPGRERSRTTPEEEEEEEDEEDEEEEEDNNQICVETSPGGFISIVNQGISSSDTDANNSASVTPSPPAKAPRSFRSKVRPGEESTSPPEIGGGGGGGTPIVSSDTPPADDGDQEREPPPADGHQTGQPPGEDLPPPADCEGTQNGSSEASQADGHSETETNTTGENLPLPANDDGVQGGEVPEKLPPQGDSDATQDASSETSQADDDQTKDSSSDTSQDDGDQNQDSSSNTPQADGDRSQENSSDTPQADGDQSREEAPEDNAPKPKQQVAPRPARRGRVIRLYNYDEEGQPYSHIKEPAGANEGAPRPKQRTRSLNRLSAIMSSVEALDVSTSPRQPEPTEEESELGQMSDDEEASVSGRLQVELEQ